MSVNIIDLIKGQLGPALVSQAATQFGESESSVAKAIGGFLPAVLGGLVNQADQPAILNAVKGAASTGLLSNLLGGSKDNPLVVTVLNTIFGDKTESVVNGVAGFSGINSSSAGSLLHMVTGAALGSIGKYAEGNNMGDHEISGLIQQQKGALAGLLPAGLSLGALGLGHWFGSEAPKVDLPNVKVTTPETPKTSVKTKEASAPVPPKEGGSIWKWLIPLALVLAAGFYLWKQYQAANRVEGCETPVNMEKADSSSVAGDSAAVVSNVRENVEFKLPNGVQLKAYKGGIEDQVVSFLSSSDYANADENMLKDKWFNFDNLNFEFGTTNLTAESKIQLDNLKAILAAYPEAKIKVGAYTDKKGNDAENLTLSQKRADAVKKALGTSQVVEAEGYGEKFATVDENATDKEREADRKTAIRFVK
ncbi:OmpA family protein [Bergeyella sp. RCAD1439]|uniref:OmpA family protein n=1 Tax=Bergeyella anatis TaxID=3113737 RepID=UPI002E199C33|nr:OmpA family protein [Bergeyella sp. RCAD1439]